MPHLKSGAGFRMILKNPSKWRGVFADPSSPQFKEAYESIYRKHLEANGFTYSGNAVSYNGITMQLPAGEPYSHILDEIFLMQVYGAPELSGRVAIDVGASIGDTALFFSQICRAKHVYGYEIDLTRYELTQKNATYSITIYNEPATADSINRLMQDKDLQDVFLKVDCEGCEYEIIPALDYSRISEVVMEYHREPQPLIEVLNKADFNCKVKKEIIFASR